MRVLRSQPGDRFDQVMLTLAGDEHADADHEAVGWTDPEGPPGLVSIADPKRPPVDGVRDDLDLLGSDPLFDRQYFE